LTDKAHYFIAFKEQTRYEEREIVSLCPLNMKISAVYCHDDGSISRSPQLAMALYDTIVRDRIGGEEIDREKGGIGFIDSIEEPFADDDGCSNFLGYEYGEERNWSEEIEQHKRIRAMERRTAIIRSIPMNLKDRKAVELLQFAQGSMDNGVLTIRSKQQRVLDYLADKVDVIREAAEGIVGAPATITLLLDERKAV